MDEERMNKPSPEAFGLNLSNYTEAIDWLRDFIHKHYGLRVGKVVHDAYPNIWRCYDVDGEIIVNIGHDMMARLALVLEHMDWLYEESVKEAEEEELRKQYEEDDGA